MLRKLTRRVLKREKSELRVTLGENVRDEIIKVSIKAAHETAYAAGNKLTKLAESSRDLVQRGVEFDRSNESATSLGQTTFKTPKDSARGDKICTGLCLVYGTCESIALACSTVKVIPFRNKLYIGAKIISKGCMAYSNACVVEGC